MLKLQEITTRTRFSLAALFVLVALAAVLLDSYRRHLPVKILQENGVELRQREEFSFRIESGDVILKLLKRPRNAISAKNVRGAFFEHSGSLNDHIVWLSRLPNLQFLSVSGTSFDDDDAIAVAHLEGLTAISCSETNLTDKGLCVLAQNRSLRMIDVGGTNVTSRGIKQVYLLRPDIKIIRHYH